MLRVAVWSVALLRAATTLASADERRPLASASRVEFERYMGTWYEIASYPRRFPNGRTGTIATHRLRGDGQIEVVSRCNCDSRDGGLQGHAQAVRVVALRAQPLEAGADPGLPPPRRGLAAGHPPGYIVAPWNMER